MTVQIAWPEARHVIRGRKYTVRRSDREKTLELSDDRLARLLREQFGLPLSKRELKRILSNLPKARGRTSDSAHM
ncbi:MAG: hypothetical protein ABIG68_10025 [Acidobacteriota bacterium]